MGRMFRPTTPGRPVLDGDVSTVPTDRRTPPAGATVDGALLRSCGDPHLVVPALGT